ncbi:MAG TPA: polysaccharide biosynthesis/export family protein [Longimicrobiaceae bacterium]|nr:polysaccharide biosynthesis/export family protein [Longimicrobiaceae bacterium]
MTGPTGSILRPFTLLVLMAASAAAASAQMASAPARGAEVNGGIQASRADLESALRADSSAAATASSAEARQRIQQDAAMIRGRLRDGDFQVGDRIALSVAGEPTLTDTFTVRIGPVLNLPAIGEIPLKGVLRSELESYLHTQLSRYFTDPEVHAQSSVRVVVSGAVGKAGFYVVPTTALVSDVLMLAGGPTRDAKLSEIRIERDSRPIWAGKALQQALKEGRTLDQLSLRAGDQIVVPERKSSIGMATIRAVVVLIPSVVLLIRLLQ